MDKFARVPKTTTVIISVLFVGTVSASASDDFNGFYKGIDAVDGSVDRLSIVRLPDRTFDIRMTSTGFAVCDNGTGPGFFATNGKVIDGELVRDAVTVTCVETGEQAELPPSKYSFQHDEDVLTVEAIGGRVNHYHRLSED